MSYNLLSYDYHNRIQTHITVKTMTNLKKAFYERREMQDIMKEYYQMKKSLII